MKTLGKIGQVHLCFSQAIETSVMAVLVTYVFCHAVKIDFKFLFYHSMCKRVTF